MTEDKRETELLNLIEYLKKNSDIDEDTFDAIRSELCGHISYYGDNFSNPRENVRLKTKLIWAIKSILQDINCYWYWFVHPSLRSKREKRVSDVNHKKENELDPWRN